MSHMEMLKARQAESTSSSFIFLRNLCSSSWEVCFSKVESTTEHTRINPPELKPPITERNSTRFNHYLSGHSPHFPTIYIQYIHLSSSITVSYLAATYAPIQPSFMQSWAFRSVAFSLATACNDSDNGHSVATAAVRSPPVSTFLQIPTKQRPAAISHPQIVSKSSVFSRHRSLHRSLSTKGADTWHLVPEETVGSEDFNYHVKHVL